VERPTDHGRACRTLHAYGTAKREPSGSRVTARDSTAPHKLGWEDAHTFDEIETAGAARGRGTRTSNDWMARPNPGRKRFPQTSRTYPSVGNT
jgi:hypothetical protein